MTAPGVKAAPRRPILWVWAFMIAALILCAYVVELGLALACGFIAYASFAALSFASVVIGIGSMKGKTMPGVQYDALILELGIGEIPLSTTAA